MERWSRNLNYGKLVKQSLQTFGMQRFEELLGEERVRQYTDNSFSLDLVYRFLSDTLKGQYKQGVFACLVGYEFNAMLMEYLKHIGATNILSEVPVGNTRVDAVAHLDGSQVFQVVMPDLTTKEVQLPEGVHTFEAKATRVVPQKSVRQLSQARGRYKNVHVFVLSDSVVPSAINNQIRQIKGDILRSGYSRSDVVKNILQLKKEVECCV